MRKSMQLTLRSQQPPRRSTFTQPGGVCVREGSRVWLGRLSPAQPDTGRAQGLRREGEAAVGQRIYQAVGDQAVQGSSTLDGVWPNRVQARLRYRLSGVPEDR